MRSIDRYRAGFTLLEALAALAILTGTTASLMMIIAINRQSQSKADADLSAALNLRTILARIGRDIPLEAGTQSGVLEDGQAWSVVMAPFKPEGGVRTAADLLLFQIHIKLGQSDAGSSYVEAVSLKRASK